MNIRACEELVQPVRLMALVMLFMLAMCVLQASAALAVTLAPSDSVAIDRIFDNAVLVDRVAGVQTFISRGGGGHDVVIGD